MKFGGNNYQLDLDQNARAVIGVISTFDMKWNMFDGEKDAAGAKDIGCFRMSLNVAQTEYVRYDLSCDDFSEFIPTLSGN